MRISAYGGNGGPNASALADSARIVEKAGFDGLWLSDRVINPATTASTYPFAHDGRVPWPREVPFIDAIVSMAYTAAVTSRIEIAIGVLVLPLRHPLVVAKQIASLDVLSGGRITLGVGVGWMAEEFEALDRDFSTRGEQTDEAIRVLRAAWTGTTPELDGKHFKVKEGTWSIPTPVHDVPIIVGGMTKPALRRAGTLGDGWFGIVKLAELDMDVVRDSIAQLRANGESVGRDPAELRAVVRVDGDMQGVAEIVPGLIDAGVDDLLVDPPMNDLEQARAGAEALKSAAAAAI